MVVETKILDRIAAVPGVKSAAITSSLPVNTNGNTDWIRFEGRPYNGVHIEVPERDVSPEYFATLHAPLQEGRSFTDRDDATQSQGGDHQSVLWPRSFFRMKIQLENRMGGITLITGLDERDCRRGGQYSRGRV